MTTLSSSLFQADGATEDTYVHLLRRLTEGDFTVGLSLNEALSILELIAAARGFFKQPLPSYDKGGSPSEWSAVKKLHAVT